MKLTELTKLLQDKVKDNPIISGEEGMALSMDAADYQMGYQDGEAGFAHQLLAKLGLSSEA